MQPTRDEYPSRTSPDTIDPARARTSSPARMSLEELGDDAIQDIFQHLAHVDVAAVANTCTSLAQVVRRCADDLFPNAADSHTVIDRIGSGNPMSL